jgi:hypothetical protein
MHPIDIVWYSLLGSLMVIMILSVVFSILGWLSKDKKTGFFIAACFLNIFPVLYTGYILLLHIMYICGVAIDGMRANDSICEYLFYCFVICTILSLLLTFFAAAFLNWKRKDWLAWKILSSQMLVFAHCFLAGFLAFIRCVLMSIPFD